MQQKILFIYGTDPAVYSDLKARLKVMLDDEGMPNLKNLESR